MLYPFLFCFIFLTFGILLSNKLLISLPIYLPFFLFLLTFLFKNNLRVILFFFSTFILGISISNIEKINIKELKNPIFIQCKVISFPKNYNEYQKFRCKVNNSTNGKLDNKIITVYNTDKKEHVYIFSSVFFIGKVKIKNNNITALSTKHFIKVDNSTNILFPIFSLKENLLNSYKKYSLNPITFSLGSALIFGEKEFLSNRLKEKFSHTGLSHLLAISGLHIAILISSFFLFLFFLKDRIKYILIMGILPVYTIFTGMHIPVLRATLMGEFYLFSKIRYLRINSMNILFLVGFVVLLISPHSLFKIAFLLSFTATLGIILSMDFINFRIYFKNEILSKVLTSFLQIILVSFIATLFTLPILLYFFGGFSPITILATPIGILLLYPYIFLSVINIFTFMKIPILILIMDYIGQIFINFVNLVNNDKFYFSGYSPSILLSFLFVIILSTILIIKFNFYKKMSILLLLFFVFIFISKTDHKFYKIFTFKGKNYPYFLLITPERESYLFADYPYYKFKSIITKENPLFNYLITNNPKSYLFSLILNCDFINSYNFKNYKFKKGFIYIEKIKKDLILLKIKEKTFILKNENKVIVINK